MAKAFNLSISTNRKTLTITEIDYEGYVVLINGVSVTKEIPVTTEQLKELIGMDIPDVNK